MLKQRVFGIPKPGAQVAGAADQAVQSFTSLPQPVMHSDLRQSDESAARTQATLSAFLDATIKQIFAPGVGEDWPPEPSVPSPSQNDNGDDLSPGVSTGPLSIAMIAALLLIGAVAFR